MRHLDVAPERFVVCRGGPSRCCPRFMTDYCIEIGKRETLGWEIKIVTYYNTGFLRSPDDWKSESLADRRK